MQHTDTIHAAAEALWQIKLENPYLRHASGLEVESLQAGSREEAQAEAARATSLAATLENIGVEGLSETDRLTLEFVRHDLTQVQQTEDTWLFGSPVAPYSSMGHMYLAQSVIVPISLDTPQAIEKRVQLWTDLARGLETAGERLRVQAAMGRRLARPAIPSTLESWRRLRSGLQAMLTPASSVGALQSRWEAQAQRLREGQVLPAIDAVIASLADPAYAAAAPEAAGLMHWPGGEAEYRRAIAAQMTVPGEPEQIHAAGLVEVAELAERMREVRSRLGFTGSEAEFHARLKTDPRVIASSPADVEARYQRCMDRIKPLLPQWFARLPRSPYGVERAPPAVESGMTYGYYDKPGQIGERGVYRYSAADLPNRSQLQVAALIYHELAPGHHLHMAGQMELAHLPALRRNALELVAFNEGWAEYASGLGHEMGLYDDPYDLYGRLAHERFTAQRMVVDTGLNALGWSLEQARSYMSANTLEGEAQVASETLRYATDLPAQALTYRLGYRWFMQLREEAEKRLGLRFDVRAFHEAVLGEGALPLAVLRDHLLRALPA